MRESLQGLAVVYLVPVHDREHLRWLVKESELLTGRPGREFFLVGGDRPALHVRLDHSGFDIVAEADGTTRAGPLIHPALRELTLELAFTNGLLFTAPIQ